MNDWLVCRRREPWEVHVPVQPACRDASNGARDDLNSISIVRRLMHDGSRRYDSGCAGVYTTQISTITQQRRTARMTTQRNQGQARQSELEILLLPSFPVMLCLLLFLGHLLRDHVREVFLRAWHARRSTRVLVVFPTEIFG